MEQFIQNLESLSASFFVILILVLLLVLNSFIFKKMKSVKSSIRIIKRSIATFLVFIGIIAFILVLPIERNLKGQILSFLGIIISAAIALSSTTILGNLMAGIMNNSMKRFRHGDLIRVNDLMGRVTKIRLFHTEIQLEDSNFVTIPNLYIASNPVKLTRKSNTVISSTVSLGYDVPRTKIEKALKDAALDAGLTDPYVYIIQLGDYAVSYKIHGFLEESDNYFSTSSQLNGKMIDHLHNFNIEIVSPSFMNQRRVDEKEFIAKPGSEKEMQQEEKSPEEKIFDKAIESEKIENKKDYLKEIDEKKEELKKQIKETSGKEDVKRIKESIKRLDEIRERIVKNIEEQNADMDEDEG